MISNLKKSINIFLESYIYLLIIWISFFPVTIQQRFHFAIKVFLMLAFAFLLMKRGISIFNRFDLTLWLFIICIGINVLFAQRKETAFKAYLDLAVPMIFLYYLISGNLCFGLKFNLLAAVICICSSLVALGAVLESIFAFNPIYEYLVENPYYRRFITGFIQPATAASQPGFFITGFVHPMSTQSHPTALGSYLLGCLPFNLLVYRQDRPFLKFLGGAGLIFGVAVILLSFSRGAFWGLMAMIVFYLFAERRYRLIAIFFILLFIFILVCTHLPHPFDRYGMDMMRAKDESILSIYRATRWIMAQRMIKDHPLMGLGLQHFRIRFCEYYPSKYEAPTEFMIADNMYLTLLSETGLIGLGGFLIFIFLFFKKAWRRLRILDYTSQERKQLLIALTAFLGLLVNMAGYELFYWPGLYILFCIVTGMLGIE